jgi:Flp pilus assembly protein TadG
MLGFCKRLTKDEGGSVVVWTTVAMTGFIGVGALVLDGGRIFNMHSQMQSYADHVALAAAYELAGDSAAISRAITAATGGAAGPIVTDAQNYSFTGDAALTVATMTFLSKLGTGQGNAGEVAGDVVQYAWAGGAAAATNAQSQASRFVEVTVTPRTVGLVMTPILAALGIRNGAASGLISARATAGFTRAACRFPPLMICNPTENPAGGGVFNWEQMIGRQILLKSQSGGAQWAPGNYGLLDLSGFQTPDCNGGGASFIRCLLGVADPGTQCVLQDEGVDLKPGNNVGPTRVGFNVRFDMWDPPLQNQRTNAAFAPARNVLKGETHAANRCREQDLVDTPSVPLPRDPGISDASRIGNGIPLANLQAYWATNHPTIAWPFAAGVKPTRYDIYRKEISLNPPPSSGEPMGPTCAPAPVTEPANMDTVQDRRVLITAVINCRENNVHGAMDNVPVENFAIMFLTEPVINDAATNGDGIFGEMLGIVKANQANGVLHEFPVLYR